VRNFWQRVSEGRELDDLWSQFTADARSSYGFYGRDVDWEEVQKLSRWRRPLHVARQFFWALLLKLSRAARSSVGRVFDDGSFEHQFSGRRQSRG
jgi:hypothetical protein